MVSRARLALNKAWCSAWMSRGMGWLNRLQAPVALGLLVEDVLEMTDPARGDAAISASWKARLRRSPLLGGQRNSWSPSFCSAREVVENRDHEEAPQSSPPS